MTSLPSNGLIAGTTTLLNSEKYSDLTITTQARSYQAHKAIVCTQSKVLAAMSDSGFRETSTSTFLLEDDDPATVERMITFLYTDNYDDGNPAVTVTDAKPCVGPILMANTLVYSIADKYDIQRLKVLAMDKFRKVECRVAWKCEDFPTIVAEIFNTTPDSDWGMRNIAIEACARNMDELLASEIWNEFLADNGAVGLSILRFSRQHDKAKTEGMKKKIAAVQSDVLREMEKFEFILKKGSSR